MAEPFAVVEDVAEAWRPLSPAEEIVASRQLRYASALIRARFPGIDDQVTSGAVDSDVLAMVTADMVRAAMVSPAADGVSQESEGVGPYSHSRSFANPLRNVFLSAAQETLIMGYRPKAKSVGFANDTSAVTPTTYYGR